jgi:hypothetical protein
MNKVSYVHFKYLPMSVRVLFTMVLLVFGVGYLMAMVQVWEQHAGKDGKPMLTAQDLIISYSGNPEGTKMESALRSSMADMLPDEKKSVVFDWLHAGSPQEQFEGTINPILQEHCVACHNPGANPHLPDFSSAEGVAKVTAKDEGMTLHTLVRVSHIHLFSITFIFFIIGFIYTHSYVRPAWFKCAVLAIPFLSLLVDIAAWYLTKLWTGFAWVIIIGGALYGVCFAIMWITSMWQMWFYKLPQDLVDNQGHLPSLHRT